ncbi:MAG: hypothetical protein Q7U47_15595 [Paludibacter sp.]|nr:hypothetical protein [Paludibacter sp.]
MTGHFLTFLLSCLLAFLANASTSIAGFYPIEGSGRQVYNFNNGWRFIRGDVQYAETADFDDSAWEVVAAPHTVQLMPVEASGCRNYQGIAWYRKRFVVPADEKKQRCFDTFRSHYGQTKGFCKWKIGKGKCWWLLANYR